MLASIVSSDRPSLFRTGFQTDRQETKHSENFPRKSRCPSIPFFLNAACLLFFGGHESPDELAKSLPNIFIILVLSIANNDVILLRAHMFLHVYINEEIVIDQVRLLHEYLYMAILELFTGQSVSDYHPTSQLGYNLFQHLTDEEIWNKLHLHSLKC